LDFKKIIEMAIIVNLQLVILSIIYGMNSPDMETKTQHLAKIIRSSIREFDCLILSTKEVVKAVCLREILKRDHLVVGDNVHIRQQQSDDRYEVTELVQRKNEIFRRIVRSNKKKVIASNIDLILIVTAVSNPKHKPFLIDRYLARACEWEIPAVVVLNKMDEFDGQFDLDLDKKKYEMIGVNFVEVSNVESSEYFKNIEKLKSLLTGMTTICLGQSGVGKSRLISTLSGGSVELLTNRLAKGVDKGSHTTTWAEIVDLGDFFMVDSPGVRSMSVSDLPIEELSGYFAELQSYFEKCQFKDCKHQENSKGCGFTDLDLDDDHDMIIHNRLTSYLKMRDEIEETPEWKR
jgi:ribosome biogenesis GTPase